MDDQKKKADEPGAKKTMEEHLADKMKAEPEGAERHKLEYGAARHLLGKAIGHEMALEEYEQTVEDAMNVRIG